MGAARGRSVLWPGSSARAGRGSPPAFALSCKKHLSLETTVSGQVTEARLRVSLLDCRGQPRAVTFSVSFLEMGELRLAGVSASPLRCLRDR